MRMLPLRNPWGAAGGAAALALLLLTGCSEPPVSDGNPQSELHAVQSELVGESSKVDRVVPGADDRFGPILPVAEPDLPPMKVEEDETPVPVVVDVEWGDLVNYKQFDDQTLPASVRQAADGARLPVLLPAMQELVDRAVVTVDDAGNWYAASMSLGDHSVLVQASRIGFKRPGDDLTDIESRDSSNDHLVSRASLIASVTFPAFGLVYTIDVECESPDVNPLCTEDDYILGIADAMAVAGGRK